MMIHLRWILFLAAAVVLLAAPSGSNAQIPYDAGTGDIPYAGQFRRGLDVVPAYDGWRPNPDGTFTLFFGYFNRNYQEELDIPIGPDNNVDGADRGQPTHFYPRRQWFVFKVVVPKDWGLERKVAWTLSIRGKTNTARGWLRPDWEINDEVMMQNLGGGSPLENERPVITGSASQTVTLQNTVELTAQAQDDGLPKPRRQRNPDPNAPGTLSIRWIQYRGPGPVTFSSPTGGGASSTTAKFEAPGIYVLRAIASDGALEAFHDVTVTVK
jgi:hypothetical protein